MRASPTPKTNNRRHPDSASIRGAAACVPRLMVSTSSNSSDMDAVSAVCERHGVTLVEDCAHTMGAHWAGRRSGTFGRVACFSTQTFKHLNSGEGGLLVTADEDVAARAVLYSGSYMLYAQHRARPSEEVFDRHRYTTPNCSMRMSSLVAAVLRPQLALRRGLIADNRIGAGASGPVCRQPRRQPFVA